MQTTQSRLWQAGHRITAMLLAQCEGDVVIGPAIVRLPGAAGNQDFRRAGCRRIAAQALAFLEALGLAQCIRRSLAVRRAVGREPDISRVPSPSWLASPCGTGLRLHPWRLRSNRRWSRPGFSSAAGSTAISRTVCPFRGSGLDSPGAAAMTAPAHLAATPDPVPPVGVASGRRRMAAPPLAARRRQPPASTSPRPQPRFVSWTA